jgi:hypothetical protein
MNPLDWSGPQGPLDVLMRFAGGALVLIVLSTVIFGALGGDEPADAVAAPTPSPTGVVTEPTGSQPPSSTEPASTEQPSAPATEPSAPATEPSAPTDDLDPSAITIQVLDGVLTDNGQAMSDVVAQLQDLGFDVVAENRARQPYEQTTVFFTAGHEEQARKVADAIGASVVQEQPGNLSDSVQVHLVVAADL